MGVPTMMEGERWELADLNGDGSTDLVRLGASLDLYTYQHDGWAAAAASIAWPELAYDEVVLLSDIDARHSRRPPRRHRWLAAAIHGR